MWPNNPQYYPQQPFYMMYPPPQQEKRGRRNNRGFMRRRKYKTDLTELVEDLEAMQKFVKSMQEEKKKDDPKDKKSGLDKLEWFILLSFLYPIVVTINVLIIKSAFGG